MLITIGFVIPLANIFQPPRTFGWRRICRVCGGKENSRLYEKWFFNGVCSWLLGGMSNLPFIKESPLLLVFLVNLANVTSKWWVCEIDVCAIIIIKFCIFLGVSDRQWDCKRREWIRWKMVERVAKRVNLEMHWRWYLLIHFKIFNGRWQCPSN